jgi:rhodanese-related sulfurtransferase
MSTATAEIGEESTMREVLEMLPGARRALFRKYHIGGCSSCGFDPGETLGQVCARNGSLKVSDVVDYLAAAHQDDERILISASELAKLRNEEKELRLLDIRTREEWEAARIEGATLFTEQIMTEMLGRWPREVPIAIYDHVGQKSMDAAAYFLGHGFQNVRALRGGLDAWSREVDRSVPRYRLG